MLHCLTPGYKRNQTDKQFKKKKKGYNWDFQISGKSVVIRDNILLLNERINSPKI